MIRTGTLAMHPDPLGINLCRIITFETRQIRLQLSTSHPRPEIAHILEDIGSVGLGHQPVVRHDQHGTLGVGILGNPS